MVQVGPSTQTLLDLCKDALSDDSNRIAIEHYYEEQGEIRLHTLSYKDLNIAADKVSDILTLVLENRSSVIGLVVHPCTELVVCILGVLKAKCAVVPLEVRAQNKALKNMIRMAKMKFLVSLSGLAKDLEKTFTNSGFCLNLIRDIDTGQSVNNLTVFEVAGVSDTQSFPTFDVKEMAYVLSTSGTTGIPKVIAVPHQCIVPNIVHVAEIFEVNSSSIVTLMSPPTFDPFVVEMFIALANRSKLVVPSAEIKMNPLALLDVLFVRAKITILQATPALMMRFSLQDLRNTVFTNSSSLEVMAFGGEQCPSYRTIKQWINPNDVQSNKLPCLFFNIYGITEVSSWATCHRLSCETVLSGDDSPVPLGSPLSKTSLQVRSEDANVLCTICCSGRNQNSYTLSTGVQAALVEKRQILSGKLYIGGNERCCYVSGEDKTEFRDSGDLVDVIFSSDEIRLHFLGRSDSMIKRNGKKLHLNNLCEKLIEIPDVKTCHVMAVDSQVIAFIVREVCKSQQTVVNCSIVTSRESKQWAFECFKILSERCESELLPDKIVEINTFPITSHGKVDGILLRRRLQDFSNCGLGLHCSEMDLRELIFMLLPSVLKRLAKGNLQDTQDEINWERTFKEHGGDSLAAVIFLNWLDVFLQISVVEKVPNVLDMLLQNSLNDFANALMGRLVSSLQNEVHTVVKNRKRKLEHIAAIKTEGFFNFNKSVASAFLIRAGLGGSLLNYSTGNDLSKACHQLPNFYHQSGRLLPDISELWQYNVGKCIDASPLVVFTEKNEGICFIGSHQHLFAAVSLSDGKGIWSVVLPDRLESSACFLTVDKNDFVIVGCYDGGVYCFEAFSGELWWKFQTDGEVKSSPCYSQVNKLVYAGSHDGFLYALDVKRMRCQWHKHCGGGAIFSSPTVTTLRKNMVEVVYAATLGGKLFCFSGGDGETIWTRSVGKPIFSSPLAHCTGVCVGCVDSKVYFFSLEGEELWSFQTDKPIFSSPCLLTKNDSVAIGSHDGYVYNIRIADGSFLWRAGDEADRSAIYSTPCPVNENLVVYASTAGYVYVVNQTDGDVMLKKRLLGEIFSSPVVVASKDSFQILIGCRNDNLHCLKVLLRCEESLFQ